MTTSRAAAALLLASMMCAGQPEQARPRVGVALSGGSALGLAHVGVLRWFHQHRIPIDAVAGTSMGGLVGGLYATGHDSDAIAEFIRRIDWTSVFNTGAPYRNLMLRRKEDRREYPSAFEFGIKKGLRMPPGFSAGHDVGLVIARFAAPYADLASFDDLPTPFRCVATDLVAGKSKVFDHGPLQVALRSTMSIPAVFSPVPLDDQLLVDGGMLNNLPVDVVRGMHPNVVVAVELPNPPINRRTLNSIVGVAGRSVSVMVRDNEERSVKAADIVISPDLAGLASTDFVRFEEFERRGYDAAEKVKAKLLPYALSEADYARYVAAREARRRAEVITPRFVEVEGISGRPRESITEFLERHNVGEPLRIGEIDNSLTRLVGIGPYESAVYAFARKGNEDGLRVHVRQKPYGPPFLNLGVGVEGNDASNIRFSFGGRVTFINFGGFASEWRTDFSVGTNTLIATEYYYRIAGSKWFVAPRGRSREQLEEIYSGNKRMAEFKRRDRELGADFGYAAGRFSEFRAGYLFDHVSISANTGVLPRDYDRPAANFHTLRMRYTYDSQDSQMVPRRGLRASSEFRWNVHTREAFPQYGEMDHRASRARFFGPRYGVLTLANAAFTVGPGSYLPPFRLGGSFEMSAYGVGELRGNYRYFIGGYGLRAFSADRHKMGSRFYLAAGYEAGKAFYDVADGRPAQDGVVAIMGETPVGLLSFGGGIGERGHRKFFFRLGRSF